jgi:hypothetical protein
MPPPPHEKIFSIHKAKKILDDKYLFIELSQYCV